MSFFAEVRLELGIDYGTVGGFRFNTSVLVDGSGGEQRNANWGQPLGRWQIGDRSLSQSELDYFLGFHAQRKGAAEGFRFKDWADYQAIAQVIGVGNGSETQFQLIKTYTIGVYTTIRTILKPVGGTINIYSGGQQSSGWMADLTTGIITFANPPASGVAIAADFEFDVPVRFEQDNIDFRFEACDPILQETIFFLQSLTIKEIRFAPDTPIPLSPVPTSIAYTLNLGYDYGTVGGPAYNTAIATIGGGHEHRTSNWSAPRGRWQVGDRTLKREELDYLIAFHRITRGAAASFLYKDWQRDQNTSVRFEEDSLSVRFDAYDPETEEAIFYLAGLPVIEIVPLVSSVPGSGGNSPPLYTVNLYHRFVSYTGQIFESQPILNDIYGPIYGVRARDTGTGTAFEILCHGAFAIGYQISPFWHSYGGTSATITNGQLQSAQISLVSVIKN